MPPCEREARNYTKCPVLCNFRSRATLGSYLTLLEIAQNCHFVPGGLVAALSRRDILPGRRPAGCVISRSASGWQVRATFLRAPEARPHRRTDDKHRLGRGRPEAEARPNGRGFVAVAPPRFFRSGVGARCFALRQPAVSQRRVAPDRISMSQLLSLEPLGAVGGIFF